MSLLMIFSFHLHFKESTICTKRQFPDIPSCIVYSAIYYFSRTYKNKNKNKKKKKKKMRVCHNTS